jgi:hypothetical protein
MWRGAGFGRRREPQLPPQLSAGSRVHICHWEMDGLLLGRRREAMIREPGNLPFDRRRPGGVLGLFIDAGKASAVGRDRLARLF